MNTYVKIILILAGLAYLISPFDIIPDLFIPYLGWIDDTFIIAAILYLLKFGRLPSFFRKTGPNQSFKGPKSGAYTRNDFFSGGKDTGRDSGTGRSWETGGDRDSGRNKDPYVILGVSRNATKEEIQTAYRQKVKQYHPDRVSHLGEELQQLANQKFVEIKEAYDTLMKRV